MIDLFIHDIGPTVSATGEFQGRAIRMWLLDWRGGGELMYSLELSACMDPEKCWTHWNLTVLARLKYITMECFLKILLTFLYKLHLSHQQERTKSTGPICHNLAVFGLMRLYKSVIKTFQSAYWGRSSSRKADFNKNHYSEYCSKLSICSHGIDDGDCFVRSKRSITGILVRCHLLSSLTANSGDQHWIRFVPDTFMLEVL